MIKLDKPLKGDSFQQTADDGSPFSVPFVGDSVWTLVDKIPRPFTTVDHPRMDPITGQPIGKVLIRLLSQQEQHLAAASAHKHALKTIKADKGQAYEDVYRTSASLEVLQAACFSAEIYERENAFKHFYPAVMVMRDKLTQDETVYLIHAYLTLQATQGAVRDITDQDDVDFWAFMLLQDPVQTIAKLSHDGMVSLMLAMAEKLQGEI